MFPSSKTSYIEANNLTCEETCIFSTEHTHKRPDAQKGASGAHELLLRLLAHGLRRLVVGALRPKALFCDFFVKKARIFSPKLGGNFPYKYRNPHSLFSRSERSGPRGRRAP